MAQCPSGKPVMDGVPQDPVLELISFSDFINNTDSGIECKSSEFAGSTELSS